MKTLANPADMAEIVARLGKIGPASQRCWGKMTVAEMVCHLSDAFRLALGDKTAAPLNNVVSGKLMKFFALRAPMQWPQGIKTVPECEVGIGGTPPVELERDMAELQALLERFSLPPPGFVWPRHPIFGSMNCGDWMRWGYLHMDHHLRQFGV